MRLIFLGTGTSHGIPVIGCACRVCRSPDPRDSRYRSSLFLSEGDTSLLIDAGPELRLQALRAGFDGLDALLLTHAHADHLHGLDDLRALTRGRPLPLYANRSTLDEVRERFAYVFRRSQIGGGKPRFDLREAPMEGFTLGGLRIVPIPLLHGELPVLGWRIGTFAYLSDCSCIPEESFPRLRGVEVVAIDGLRLRPHPTHFSVDQAIDAARKIGARETWIVHITHDHSHAELEAHCRERGADVGARPAWDGLELSLASR